jgi:hypothetical protein
MDREMILGTTIKNGLVGYVSVSRGSIHYLLTVPLFFLLNYYVLGWLTPKLLKTASFCTTVFFF